MASEPLFLSPPVIVAEDYLPKAEAAKTAAYRLESSPSAWSDEILQVLSRDYPFIPLDQAVVTFKRRDDAQGYALGMVSFSGAPRLTIPIIVRNRMLAPMDILIIRREDENSGGGVGDVTDDQVMPLTQTTFTRNLEVSDIGTPTPDHMIKGTGATEDGSSLRLPTRGRTVLASVMGANGAAKTAFAKALGSDKNAAAGVLNYHTTDVFESWLNAPTPKSSISTKIASTEIERATAVLPDISRFVEITVADAKFADVVCEDDTIKTAAFIDFVDLRDPSKPGARNAVFADGTYTPVTAEKIAGMTSTGSSEEIVDALQATSLKIGSTISFGLLGRLTAPLKIASLEADEGATTIRVHLTDGLATVPVLLSSIIKQAAFDTKSATWLLPQTTPVYAFNGAAPSAPATAAKLAQSMKTLLPNRLSCAGGTYSLEIPGTTLGGSFLSESKMATVLGLWFANADEMLRTVKTAAETSVDGTARVRFAADLTPSQLKVASASQMLTAYPALAREYIERTGIEMAKAVKLAASIGDPQGVDATLAAGFLHEDNLQEFLQMAPDFEDAVSSLARLLLAIRMGFPGDENTTAVAMRALNRVTENLSAATGELTA